MLESWIAVARESDFPLDNLPFGIFVPRGGHTPRAGTIIGDRVVDLLALAELGYFSNPALKPAFAAAQLNGFLELGRAEWRTVRHRLQELFAARGSALSGNADHVAHVLHAAHEVTLKLPVAVGDYVDFYASKEHASNVGRMFRDEKNALLPNWVHIPIGYHGRAGSIVESGRPVRRPCGQLKAPDADRPVYAPSRELDFELEVAFVSGKNTEIGTRLSPGEAEDAIFGFALFNDWSARDIQRWEYVPLGPFLGKSFSSSLSPWLITLDALEPFRTEGPAQDVEPLPYLRAPGPGHFDMTLEVWLRCAHSPSFERVTRTNLRTLYWSPFQQISHLTSNGSPLRVGDLCATGTVSGSEPDSFGSLLELAWKGTRPLKFANGETRTFLQDGDEVLMKGYCEKEGLRVGLGEVRGRIEPAL